MSLKDEGTITFWARPPYPDAFTDAKPGRFPSVTQGDFKVEMLKNPDRTVTISLIGVHHRQFSFTKPIPPCDDRGLFVAVTWDSKHVILYLNGNEAQRADVTSH